MANEEPKQPEGKFSEVARKSREKRAELEQRKVEQDMDSSGSVSNGGGDVKIARVGLGIDRPHPVTSASVL
jgi:hypothetical protein